MSEHHGEFDYDDQATLAQPHSEDYSHIEPLPDRRGSLIWCSGRVSPHSTARWVLTSPHPTTFCSPERYTCVPMKRTQGLAPDFIFARQVSDPERVIRRNGYVISEVGKPPDLVLEVGSRSTGRGTIP